MTFDDLPKGVVRSKAPQAGPTSVLAEFESESIEALIARPARRAGNSADTENRITAIDSQARDESRVNVFVDGRFAIGLFAEVATGLGLRVGQTVTPERLDELAAAETRRRACEDAYRLLSYRDRAENELAERLRRKGYDDAVITDVQEHLRAVGFLNDESFAERWVANRGISRGRRALQHELRAKGVDAATISAALESESDGEQEGVAARTAAIRRVGECPTDRSRPAQTRLAAYLTRRGFDWETIRPILAEIYGAPASAEDDDVATDPVAAYSKSSKRAGYGRR